MHRVPARALAALAALPLAALPTACQDPAQSRREEIERLAQAHERHLEEFALAQAEFRRANPVPQRLELGPDGTLLVRECELQGRLGAENLRVKFSYVNSTGHTLDAARVTLTLRDPESGVAWSEVQELRIPFGLGFHPNSSYTSEFRMPLRGLYTRPDWEWSLSAEALAPIDALE